jgi:hypothetical protein
LEKSGNGFADIVTNDDMQPCIAGTATACDCPGGGSVTVVGTTFTAVNCKSSDGLTYNGTMTIDFTAGTADVAFTTFGECSNIAGTTIDFVNCSGTMTGTCAGVSETCVLSESGDDCECS